MTCAKLFTVPKPLGGLGVGELSRQVLAISLDYDSEGRDQILHAGAREDRRTSWTRASPGLCNRQEAAATTFVPCASVQLPPPADRLCWRSQLSLRTGAEGTAP
jgi:hypothetical protein